MSPSISDGVRLSLELRDMGGGNGALRKFSKKTDFGREVVRGQ